MSYNIIDVAKDFVQGTLTYVGGAEELHRIDICNACDASVAGMCSVCGCIISVKVKLAKSECPMGLWTAVSD